MQNLRLQLLPVYRDYMREGKCTIAPSKAVNNTITQSHKNKFMATAETNFRNEPKSEHHSKSQGPISDLNTINIVVTCKII